MIALGLRLRWLGSKRLNWRDLLVVVKHSPETSAYYRAVHGEDSQWNLANQLAASIKDLLALLWWAKTKDAERGRNMPKPTPRPGITDDSKKQIGSGSLEVEAMKAWLGGDFVNLN